MHICSVFITGPLLAVTWRIQVIFNEAKKLQVSIISNKDLVGIIVGGEYPFSNVTGV